MGHYYEMRRERWEELTGKEILDITPVMVGGDPNDPTNKVVLNRHAHIQAVRYWNQVIRDAAGPVQGSQRGTSGLQ
jgi:hypothetical protein